MLRQLANTLLLGALGALALAARVLVHGETFNDRTELIVLLAGLSGAMAGLVLTPVFAGRTGTLWRWRACAGFVWVFMATMTALYVLKYEFLSDQVDHVPYLRGFGLLKGMAHTATAFLAFCPTYLLPWELPLLALLGALILPGLPRRNG